MFNLPGKYNKSKCVCMCCVYVQIYGFKLYKGKKMDRTTTNRQIDNHGAKIQHLFSSVLLLLKEKKKKNKTQGQRRAKYPS